MLITVFGGAGQGMEEYARKLFPGKEALMCRAAEMVTDAVEQAELLIATEWEDFVSLFADKSEMEMLDAASEILTTLEEKAHILVLTMTECGCGIVPLGAAERRQRERCGILLHRIAARSDRVDRVMGGLGICLKEEKGVIS